MLVTEESSATRHTDQNAMAALVVFRTSARVVCGAMRPFQRGSSPSPVDTYSPSEPLLSISWPCWK